MRDSAGSSAGTVRATTAASVTRPDRFRLTGPTRSLDPRVNAIRPDLADAGLADVLFAPHYATPRLACCGPAAVMMRDAPSDMSRAVSQLLPGEDFATLDVAGGWAWGYSTHDHYVGYVPGAALVEPTIASHRVTMPMAPVFAEADIKSPVVRTLPVGSRLAGVTEEDWLTTANGHVHARHIAPLTERHDPVSLAERLVGLPYLWGGRGAGGIDCSGLVQLALGFAGVASPRDSDQQQALGEAATGAAQRGDLVFLPGHVGLMLDAERLLHANAHWMGVVAEPLADVLARGGQGTGGIVARRRLP